jgi:hypothetical protein
LTLWAAVVAEGLGFDAEQVQVQHATDSFPDDRLEYVGLERLQFVNVRAVERSPSASRSPAMSRMYRSLPNARQRSAVLSKLVTESYPRPTPTGT